MAESERERVEREREREKGRSRKNRLSPLCEEGKKKKAECRADPRATLRWFLGRTYASLPLVLSNE